MEPDTETQDIFKILILGLEGTGKTSIARSLALKPRDVLYKPTIGVNFYKTTYQNSRLVLWDVGGLEQFRKLWRIFFPGTDGILYVLDGRKYEEIIKSLQLLMDILVKVSKPVVLLVNKQDSPGAITADAIESILKDREISVVGTSALADRGIKKALSCLMTKIHRKQDQLPSIRE